MYSRSFIAASRVRAGTSRHDRGGTIYDVEHLIAHPRYDKRDQNYNVGLIMITKDFNETRRSRPAKLVEANVDLPVGSFVTATGWGSETVQIHCSIV